MAKRASQKFSKGPAVVCMFDDESDPMCAPVRSDVDAVLSKATDNGITPTTSNDDLLTDYMASDDISALYILLNRRLVKYPKFKRFISSDIKANFSVGEIRSAAYTKCDIKCLHV